MFDCSDATHIAIAMDGNGVYLLRDTGIWELNHDDVEAEYIAIDSMKYTDEWKGIRGVFHIDKYYIMELNWVNLNELPVTNK